MEEGRGGERRKGREGRDEERRESLSTAMARVLGPQAGRFQYGKLLFLGHTVISVCLLSSNIQ